MRDMTRGSIPDHLIRFSIPLILGNLFQLTYNAADSVIVGRFAGKSALAAVGTANPVMNIVILGISGICIGASVLMSEFYGGGKYQELKKEVSTTLLFGCYFSLAVMALGFFLSKSILRLFGVPAGILDISAWYLRIIFLGMPFTYLYNAVSAAMRSVGDSQTPIKFLAAASGMNVCLDMVFVAGFHMGVTGAALATVLAEGSSAVLCIFYVYRKVPLLQIRRQEIHMDRALLRKTLQHGSITALQQSCQPVGKLLIQGVINPLGVDTIAAFNAVNRVDDFAFTPEQSISHGMMTFVAQNRGAGKKDRVGKGLRTGLCIEISYWILICLLILLFRRPIMRLFVQDGETGMVELGAQYLGLMAFFYVLPALTNGIQGFFRGMGNMKVTLISTVIQISFRVLFVWVLVPVTGMKGVAFASMIGWSLMLLYEIPYYFRFRRRSAFLSVELSAKKDG